MRTKTIKASLLLLLFNSILILISFGQEIPPFVYTVENTGVDCTAPPLPAFADLPVIKPLTDPFEWSDRSGRDTTFANWTRRRAEIKAEIEHYEIGLKPDRPDTISAFYANDTLTVHVVKNGDTLTLISPVILPEGEGPFPAVIGIGLPSGFIPADIFTSRDIAQIEFNYTQVMAHTQSRGHEPINKLYPDLIYMGAYSAWSWGVSRLIDGLELVSGDLPIDLEHLAITGCSFAGKMALFAGAFDERIALTIAQESGGGGAAAWRVSETLGAVETLGSTSHAWFIEDMFQFAGRNVSKLPHDHHELMAMVAPRALFVIGNPSYIWLADESGYVSCEAAKRVWENFGIEDRFGYSIVSDPNHCFPFPAAHKPRVEAFVDKFMLGDTLVNTDIAVHPYADYVIPAYWTEWWGKGDPYFPVFDRGESEEVWYEAECSTVGAAWNVRLDTMASNGSYAVVKPGLNNNKAPADSGAAIYFPFNVASGNTYYVYGRVNSPTYDNDQYWIKIDDEPYVYNRTYLTEGWEWNKFAGYTLSAGEHTLSIAFRSEGFKLDKICISEFYYPPGEKGEPAEFSCVPDTTTKPYVVITLNDEAAAGAYSLGQNFPNPLNDKTTIDFELPRNTYASLKVYSILGEEIAELAGMEYPAGKHTVEFNARNLSGGMYFYTLKTAGFSATRRMIILAE
ncbi:MAG: T9SS type A sorting domain-containing protein [Bacteroidales bacterium]|nr:T9SS type A sorting domain-containing protein [Bacteroidales bacterium]